MPRETEVRMGAEAETGRRGSGAEKRGRAESRDTRNASCKSSLSYRIVSISAAKVQQKNDICKDWGIFYWGIFYLGAINQP